MSTKIDQLVSTSTPRSIGSRAGPAQSPAAGGGPGGVEATRAIDTVERSGDARTLQQMERKAGSAPVEDSARVAEIRQALADGSYRIDAGKVADGLLDAERVYRK